MIKTLWLIRKLMLSEWHVGM